MKKTLSWKPVLNGAIYCAPACGGGCTVAAHDLAKTRAADLAQIMGEGWKPEVWENLGWHYKVVSPCGRWKIHPHHYGDRDRRCKTSYTAFLSPESDSLGGRWAASADTPKAAMLAAWEEARPEIERMTRLADAKP